MVTSQTFASGDGILPTTKLFTPSFFFSFHFFTILRRSILFWEKGRAQGPDKLAERKIVGGNASCFWPLSLNRKAVFLATEFNKNRVFPSELTQMVNVFASEFRRKLCFFGL